MRLVDHLEGRTTALTVGEVAKILSVSARQIYKLAALNEIPSIRVGAAIRFDPAVVREWIGRSSAPAKFPPVRAGEIPGTRRRRA